MEDIPRREFARKATLAVAAGSLLASAPKVISDSNQSSQHPVALYRETEEWKKYYETLK